MHAMLPFVVAGNLLYQKLCKYNMARFVKKRKRVVSLHELPSTLPVTPQYVAGHGLYSRGFVGR